MIYTVCDIETEGLNRYSDEILSFGFIRCDSNFDILASGSLYFYKDGFHPERYPAFNTHHLTTDFMKEHKDEFNDNMKRMYSLLYMGAIVGKNSTNFDMPFIQEFIQRHCPMLPRLEYFSTFDVQTEFCKVYQQRTGNSKKGTLTEYVDCLGITENDLRKVYDSLPVKDGANMHMHGALFDTVATYLVFKETCRIINLRP